MEPAIPGPTVASRDLEYEALALRQVEAELRKVLIGQQYLVDRMLVGLLCRGHLLIEGVPGLAKTLAVKTLARTLSIRFQRIQFTPDLLPADLIGPSSTTSAGEFVPRKGPSSPSCCSPTRSPRAGESAVALLESMEERQVTLGDTTYRSPSRSWCSPPDPIEQEGTYPLARRR